MLQFSAAQINSVTNKVESLSDLGINASAAELNKLSGSSGAVTAAKLSTLSALSNTEIAFLDGASSGSITASKVLVADASSNVSAINVLGVTQLSASGLANVDSVQIGGNTILTSDGDVTAVGVSGSGAFQAGGALTVAGDADLNGILDVASHISGAGDVVLSLNDAKLLFTRGGSSDKARIQSPGADKLNIYGSGSGAAAGVVLKNGEDDRLRVKADSVAFTDADLAIGTAISQTTFLNSDRSQFTLAESGSIGIDDDTDLITLTANTASVAGLLYATNIVADDASGFAGTGLVDNNGSLDVSGLTNNEIASGAGIEFTKMETVTAGDIIVANGSGVPTAVAMSGHVAIDNAGATTIQNSTITSAMVSGTLAGDKIALNGKPIYIRRWTDQP